MDVITKEELETKGRSFMNRFSEEIFLYPTDTVYGIGCDATNPVLVKKLRDLKGDHKKPMSVIAPSIDWVNKNCEVTMEAKKSLSLLPGPYTIVLPIKNNKCIAKEANNYFDSVGVRIPRHWISDLVNSLGFPIITTSANITGDDFITKIEDLSSRIKTGVGFAIDEGEIKGKPSQVIKVTSSGKEILRD